MNLGGADVFFVQPINADVAPHSKKGKKLFSSVCEGGEAVSILVFGPENISVFSFYLLVLLQRIYYTFNNSLKTQTVLLPPRVPN